MSPLHSCRVFQIRDVVAALVPAVAVTSLFPKPRARFPTLFVTAFPGPDWGWTYGNTLDGGPWITPGPGETHVKSCKYRRRCWLRACVASPATAAALCGPAAATELQCNTTGEAVGLVEEPAAAYATATGHLGLRRIPFVRLNQPRHVVFAVHGVGVHSHSTMRRKVRCASRCVLPSARRASNRGVRLAAAGRHASQH